MWSYKDHGKSYEAVYGCDHPPGFRWLHDSFGSNWRMTEMQAVIGRIQLGRMAEWTAARSKNSSAIDNAVAGYKVVRTVSVTDDCVPAHYKYYLFVQPEYLAAGWTRDRIVDRGVPCYHGSCAEVYLERAYDDTDWRPEKRLVNASLLGETTLMLLVHPTLTDIEMARTCEVLIEVLAEAERRCRR